MKLLKFIVNECNHSDVCAGQDVSGVLDSSVAVDTSILEQYLCNDMDPSSL